MAADILIIDDEQDVARTVQMLLRRGGLAADIADSGKNGLAVLDKYKLILLDIMMPKMSGAAVLSEMAKRRLKKKVIVMTAIYILDDMESELGAIYPGVEFISKSRVTDEIVGMAKKALRRKG